MLVEWRTWGQKLIKWRADLAFDEQFRKDEDASETKIKVHIDSMIEALVDEVQDPNLVNQRILE